MDVRDLLKRVGENLSVSRSFGTAYEKDGLLIIPVALVAGGGGGGGGPMSSSRDDSNKDRDDATADDAGGAGFGGVVMPVGAYVVKGQDVRWVPAVNVTLIALAALAVLRVTLRRRAKGHSRHHG